MIVPAEAMRKLLALEQAVADAARRRDEAVQLVLAALGAPLDARIDLRPDGSGQIVGAEANSRRDS